MERPIPQALDIRVPLKEKGTDMNKVEKGAGGGGGIRTRDTVSRIHTFQACAFVRQNVCY